MAPHSSTLAWRIPWAEEPGRLQSMGCRRVRLDWATSLSLFTFIHWRRKWQPTPVFLPGESQGERSLVGCRLWGRTESDTTAATQQQHNNKRPVRWRTVGVAKWNCWVKGYILLKFWDLITRLSSHFRCVWRCWLPLTRKVQHPVSLSWPVSWT